MKRRRYNWFFIMSVIVLLFSAVVSLIFPREVIQITINRWHIPFLDTVFRYWTLLGNGLILLAIVLIPLFLKIREEGAKREIPLVIHTVKAFSEGRVSLKDRNIIAEGKVLSGPYCLTEEIEKQIKQ